MHPLSVMFVVIVAGLHFYFLWLEMFAWTTRGPKVFTSLPSRMFEPTKALAANQGLYNGFLSSGLVWSLFIQDDNWSKNVAAFFLLCVIVAGVYGAATISKKIFIVQGVPALLGLASLAI